MDDDRTARLRAATGVLDAYVAALDRRHDVLDAIFESETAEDAEVAIVQLLGVTRDGAQAIMNIQLRRATRSDRARVIADRDEHLRRMSDPSSG